MDFVLKALAGIGYVKDIDTSDPNVRARFSSVVESSEGKNPRFNQYVRYLTVLLNAALILQQMPAQR